MWYVSLNDVFVRTRFRISRMYSPDHQESANHYVADVRINEFDEELLAHTLLLGVVVYVSQI